MRGGGYRMRRWVMRSAGQVAVSILATVAATAIYAGLRHGYRAIEASPPAASAQPAVTSGGKLAARVEGGRQAAFDPPVPRLPLLSVVNWTAPAPADWTSSQAAPVAPARLAHASRQPRRVAGEGAAVLPPPPPPELRVEALPAAPARPEGLLARATGPLVAALDGAADAVVGTARGAVASGGALIARLGH